MIKGRSSSDDVAVVDLTPILAVTDAALVGRVVGVKLLVRAGRHPVCKLQLAVEDCAETDLRLSGLVFNDVPQGKVGRGGYACRYGHQYSYKPGDKG